MQIFGDWQKAGLALVASAFIGGEGRGFLANATGAALTIAGVYFIYRAIRKPKTSALKRDFEELTGKLDKVDYSDFVPQGSVWFGKAPYASGIAIDLAAGRLVLAVKDKVQQYPLTAVRGYETRLIRAGQVQVYGAGIAESTRAGGHNAGQAIRAVLDSGLFIRVKDVEHPIWQLGMLKEPMLQRWAEILSQAFEGGFSDSEAPQEGVQV